AKKPIPLPLPLQSLSNAETPKAPVTNPNPIRANQKKVGSSSLSAALSLSSNPCLSLLVDGLVASLRPSSPRRRTKACTELFASPCPSSSSLCIFLTATSLSARQWSIRRGITSLPPSLP
ncbi:hypothetical protein S245_067982, partial [Arachis hypogaea]